MSAWKSVGDRYLYGIARNNFTQDKPHRISLDVGDAVIIIKETSHWYFGYNKYNSSRYGIFPKSYVQIVDSVLSKKEYVIKRSEIVEEITTVLGDWYYLFKRFYLTKNELFQPIRRKIHELVRFRSQILSGNLPVDEMKEVKLMATSEIDTGNRLLGLDMVVRDETGNILDINSTSTTQLHQQHMSAVDRIKKATNSYNKNRTSKSMYKHSHNLLITVHAFVCKHQEDSDLLLILYDGDEQKAFTENYVVKWGKQGLARDLDQFDNHRVLFTDLSSHDLNRNKVYLICYVVRIGAMDIKESDFRRSSVQTIGKKHSQLLNLSQSSNWNGEPIRRPFGVAAIDLTPILRKPDDFKNNLDLPFILCEKDSLDTTLRKLIANKDVGKIDSKLAVSVELLHGDIKQVKEEYPHLVHGNVAFARKMGFPEVIFPGDVRNDLYLTLVGGEFSKGAKSSDKNIEITVVVCNEKGVVVPGLITLGAGASLLDEYKSVVYYHEDKPKWNETFKVQVPIDEFKQCHLRFTFKHRSSNETKDRSEKPFGLSYVRLMQENGTTLQHKCHQLIVYKIDHKKFDMDAKMNYLSLPSLHSDLSKNPKPTAAGLSIANKDSFIIETNLCSTKLTQNVHLLGLLNWSTHKETLEETLKAFLHVKAEEVVKFLQDILDALFNILVENDDPAKYDNLVFICLLKLIEIVSDLKFQHFLSVLDLYLNESFSATLSYDKLINILQVHIRNAINSKMPQSEFETMGSIYERPSEEFLFKTTKNLQYIVKFIIRSRILFANLNDDRDRNLFERNLEELLDSFKQLLSCPNDLLRSQGAILKYLHIIASDLIQVYDSVKLSHTIVDIITSIPPGRLVQSKMACIKDMVNSKLFKLPECRAVLLPVFCHQIKDKLESKEEGDIMCDIWQQEKNLAKAAKVLGELKSHLHTRETTGKAKIAECINIMNNLLELLFSDDVGPTENDVRDIIMILLRTVIQTSIAMDRDNPFVGSLVAIMLGIFRSMKTIHYNIYVSSFRYPVDLQDSLTEILLLFNELVSRPVFPNDWMDMIMHQNAVILESLRQFAKVILEYFSSPFEKQIWLNFFHCAIAFLTQPALQLDQFNENKKSTILLRYKDIRHETANEIAAMWFNLGEHKTKFVPQLVGPILEMSLLPEPDVREVTIPIFFDMMQCEFYKSILIRESYGDTKRNNCHMKGNFDEFEKEMIAKLDILVEGGRGDHEYKDLFYTIMMGLCSDHNTLQMRGQIFVTMVTELMGRLLEYRYNINDESKENRMACTVSLLQFYSGVERKEMYIRYVYKLHDLHMEFDNFTEAAFTLKLHSNLLKWDGSELTSLLQSQRHANCRSHRQLKEALYLEIIDYFDKGKMWECAIDMCKELAHQYEYETFDYINLSQIHVKLSEFYKKILNLRHESEYFRVAFYGLRFPEFLRNQIFIYRGKEYERLAEFCSRILTQHPAAELMQTLTTPGDEITQSDGQYIQINSVEPIMDQRDEFRDKVIPQEILKYYRTNNVQRFRFSRPYRDTREGGGGDDNIKNLWLERTIMKTKHEFPDILRWFPVTSSQTFKISPIEYAVETMELTNLVIRDLVLAHKNDESLPINPFSMKINGIVDPAVMGGFSKYEEAFLTKEYLEANVDHEHLVNRLKELIASQIPLLEVAIRVHRSKAPANMLPFHERLEKCFAEMQARVEANYGKRKTDITYDRDSMVMIRRQGVLPQMSFDSNRLSETSMGSSDSGLSKSTQSSRPQTSSMKSTFAGFNFNPSNLGRTSLGYSPSNKGKPKEKTPKKRRQSQKIDRESLSLPVANSLFYTTSSPLPTISATPTADTNKTIITSPPPTSNSSSLFELSEQLMPQRPLRSEVERERRLSRRSSTLTPTSSVKGFVLNEGDTLSMSGDSSKRNSIVTTDSTTSEEELIPPPLPAKAKDCADYSNLLSESNEKSIQCTDDLRERKITVSPNKNRFSHKPLPPIPSVTSSLTNNYAYDLVETRNLIICDEKRRPPTPPPKPSRNSKYEQVN